MLIKLSSYFKFYVGNIINKKLELAKIFIFIIINKLI